MFYYFISLSINCLSYLTNKGIHYRLLKFDDDTKLFWPVGSVEEVHKIREDLVKLSSWSAEWLMLFNIVKCKVLHAGKDSNKINYEMRGKMVDSLEEERDWGVIIISNLKVSKQCKKIVDTANKVLVMIYRTFTYRTSEDLLLLYKSLVRPHLEYCIQAWRPFLKTDIDLLEKIQRRATRMMADIWEFNYEDRLSYLGLTTLEPRRLKEISFTHLKS